MVVSGLAKVETHVVPTYIPYSAFNQNDRVTRDKWKVFASHFNRTLPDGEAAFVNWLITPAKMMSTPPKARTSVSAKQVLGVPPKQTKTRC